MNTEYTGGRAITIADLTPGTQEYDARESFRKHIEDQYLWELDRQEKMHERMMLARIVGGFLAVGVMLAAFVIGTIALGYYIGA